MSKFGVFGLLSVVAIIATAIGIALWWQSGFLFHRHLGNYRFAITMGSETEIDGTRYRTLSTQYRIPDWALMYGVRTFSLPNDGKAPSFVSIQDKENNYFCVYDSNGWGYIAIVDLSNNELFCSEPHGIEYVNANDDWSIGYTEHIAPWIDAYLKLKSDHPDIPYGNQFLMEPPK